MPFARTCRAPTATFATILPTATTASHADALPPSITTVASLLLLQRPILSREHTRRDRYVCCLPALVMLSREMGVVTRVHGENSNLLVPRAGSDDI